MFLAIVFSLAIILFFVIAKWRMYAKAGQPGWGVLIPIYNAYLLLKIVGKPGWWLLLYLIPGVNVVIMIITLIELAKVFGKGSGFAVLLIFLPFIAIPMLSYGSAEYQGPAE